MKKHTYTNKNIILSVLLFVCVTCALVSFVIAATPDPGHPFTQASGGVVQGDLLYGSAADTLLALPKDTNTTRYLSNTGASNNPAWAQINLANGVTGALPVSKAGTGAAPASDDQLLVSSTISTATWQTLGDCTGTGYAFTYNQTTNTWGCNYLNATTSSIGSLITGAVEKTALVAADMIGLMDSTDGILKKLSWSDMKTTLAGTFLSLDNSAATASVLLKDNDAITVKFTEGFNTYLGFDTTNGDENVFSNKRHDFFSGATFYSSLVARMTPRVGSVASSAEPTINTDNYDAYSITALATPITSMSTNLSGAPADFDRFVIRIKDNGTPQGITWGASFSIAGAPLPSTTVASTVLTVELVYNTTAGTWGCVSVSANYTPLLYSFRHSDTTTGTVVRGDVITGQGGTPTWSRLAKGTAGQALMMDSSATDVAWAKPLGYEIMIQALSYNPGDGGTVYFGQQPRAPGAVGLSKVYIRKAGTITAANIYARFGVGGTNEAWSLYIRHNNTTDYLIQTLSVAATERIWVNTGLSIAVAAGDYIEIKSVQPTWPVTNPTGAILGGYVYVE
jgi:hypothetical protein